MIGEVPKYSFNQAMAPVVEYQGVLSFLFLPYSEIQSIILNMAMNIDPENTCFAVNQTGGSFLAKELQSIFKDQNSNLQSTIFTDIEYKSSNNDATSGNVRRIRPIMPEIIGNRRLRVVEDVVDTQGTIKAILSDAITHKIWDSGFVTLFSRIDSILPAHPHVIGARISREWVGGLGMDYGTPEVVKDYPRSSKDLLVRIDPKQLGRVQEEINSMSRLLIHK